MAMMPRALGTKLRAWRVLPPSDKWLSLELAFELARARFEVSFVPLRIYTRDLGSPQAASNQSEPDHSEPAPNTLHLLSLVRALTRSLPAVLPWNCTCLVRALAAFRVLRRRGCRTSLCLGVRKNPSDLEAHAWLSHGSRVITGGTEATGFSPLVLFKG
jgi:hypothetical protein